MMSAVWTDRNVSLGSALLELLSRIGVEIIKSFIGNNLTTCTTKKISSSSKFTGSSFTIYTQHLFRSTARESLEEVKDPELLKAVSDPTTQWVSHRFQWRPSVKIIATNLRKTLQLTSLNDRPTVSSRPLKHLHSLFDWTHKMKPEKDLEPFVAPQRAA